MDLQEVSARDLQTVFQDKRLGKQREDLLSTGLQLLRLHRCSLRMKEGEASRVTKCIMRPTLEPEDEQSWIALENDAKMHGRSDGEEKAES